jgi:hypothetical protein
VWWHHHVVNTKVNTAANIETSIKTEFNSSVLKEPSVSNGQATTTAVGVTMPIAPLFSSS